MNQKLLRSGGLMFLLCTFLASVSWAQINVTLTATNPTCSGFTNGSITAMASGGNGSYSFVWNNGQGGQILSGLAAGTYSVTVTDTDGNTGTRSASLTAPSALSGAITQGGSLCALNDNASVVVTGGTAPYTYLWQNGQTGTTATNLGFGTVCVDITDANNCEQRVCEHLAEPLSVDAQAEDVLCPGGCDGVIVAIVSGGARPVTYLWDDGSTNAVNDMLLPGTYCVTVTDNNGCTAQDCGTIGQPAPFTFNFTTTNPDCGATNGSVSVAAGGGTPPYTYVWNNGTSGASLSNIGEGTYAVTVTDANGCSGSESVSVAGSNLVITIDATSPACGVGATGSATAIVAGGTAPFTFNWTSGSTTATAGNLAPGMYSVSVTDAAGCVGMASTTITAGSTLNVTATSTDVLCAGDSNGSASVMVSGGQPPYTYLWNNNAIDPTIDGLAPGTYDVMVSDAAGCAGAAQTTVGQPVALMCNISIMQAISAFGADDGQISAQFNGGVMPYTINWNTGQTGQVLSDLGPGTYSATVTDGNGCTTTCDVTLVEPAPPALGKIGNFVWRDFDGNGQQDAGEPGVEGVTVTLTLPDGSEVTQLTLADGSYCFEDLAAGDYKVTFQINPRENDKWTRANTGNDETDSDAVPMSGMLDVAMTGTITLAPGDTNLTIDAGLLNACIEITDPGTIEATDLSVCGIGADPGPINSTSPAVSAGAIRYLWMRNSVPDPNFGNWQTAPGVSNQPSYDPGPIYETTYYARCAFGVDCNVPVETEIVEITVGTTSRAIISGPDLVCVDETYTFEAANAGGGAIYEWDFGPRATPQTATGRTVNVTWAIFGQRNVTLKVTRQGCETFNSKRVAISNCFTQAPFIIQTNPTGGNAVSVTWEMAGDTEAGQYKVQRSFDGGVSFTDIGSVAVELGTEMKSYEFMDNSPKLGYNVYRVVRVLELGDTYFSETANASFVSQEVDFLAYPNPAVELITVERFDNVDLERTIELVDQSGRILRTIQFPAGQERLEVSLEKAPLGLLHLRVVSDLGVVSSMTVLKQ